MPQAIADSSPSSPVPTDSETLDSDQGLRPCRSSSARSYSTCSIRDGGEKQTPDQVLGRFGSWNPFVVFVLLAMSSVWCMTAMPMMVSAFMMGDACTGENAANCTLVDGTITKDFNLTGSRATWADWTTSAFLFGNMVGGSFPALLSDKFGRRPLLIGSLMAIGISGCIASLAPEIFSFILLRFLQGIFFTACGTASWVLAYESIPLSLRSYTALIFGLMWVTGYCAVTPLAYLLPNWRHLIIAASVPSIIVAFFFIFTIPESFHFLISRNHPKKVTRWVNRANRFRKKQPLNVNITALIESTQPEEGNERSSNGFIVQLFSNKVLFVYTFVLSYVWTCDTFVYYGLSFYSTQLAGDRFINYALLGVIEIPSYLVSPMLLDRLGRRTFVSLCHVITALSFLVVGITDNSVIVLAMWLLGKFAISCSFTSLFVYGSEIFPTVFRNGCLGVCDVVARFGGAFAPAVRSLGYINPVFPTIFFGVTSALAAGLTLLLPETLNRELPDTPEQLLANKKSSKQQI